MMRRQIKSAIGILGAGVLCAAVAGCAPVVRNHGYTPVDEDLSQVRVGQDTRGSVRRKIGQPGTTGIFTEEGWYYVSTQMEHYTYHQPKVIEREVVAVLFDQNDVVADVKRYGLEHGRIVDLETNTTPTYGRRLTVLEQAFGNIGVVAEDIFGE